MQGIPRTECPDNPRASHDQRREREHHFDIARHTRLAAKWHTGCDSVPRRSAPIANERHHGSGSFGRSFWRRRSTTTARSRHAAAAGAGSEPVIGRSPTAARGKQRTIPVANDGDSPHNGGSAGQAPLSVMMGLGQVGGSQPLTQMNRRGMLPPPPQSGGPGGMGGQQMSQAAFQSLVGRSPSQPGSPAQNHLLTAPSPSMSARQPPSVAANTQQIEQEFMRMPPPQANQIKAEIGCGDKDLNSLNLEEKVQISVSLSGLSCADDD
ncbi:hypothetical protein A0H81_06447 [Grifola frondosa]|uniref:Uncharacterized protein n=1 Tax=Grifola frondosa TaxID=5627 RepID=A0A1C7MC99_GRIFR|nr:hypothetical protein A0H81_06447 [Grifola frondosa]